MEKSQNIRRFRINPVEVVIFAAVSLVFLHSTYSLVMDPPSAHLGTEKGSLASSRIPATSPGTFQSFELSCTPRAGVETMATKIRLTGPLCGAHTPLRLLKTQIVNQANRFGATVFTDLNASKFSTDYIPLQPGKNPIQVEFTYDRGKGFSGEFSVQKNEN